MSTIDRPIRDFNRYELKYVVTLDQAEGFKRRLEKYMVHDPNAAEGRGYSISSLYYDSPDRHAYWEKIEGLKFRRKVRIRRYDHDPAGMCFAEIKQRIDKTVQKRRARIPFIEAQKLMEEGTWDQDQLGNDPVLGEIVYLKEHYALESAVIVSYERDPYIGIYDSSLRVTFDTNLRGRMGSLTSWGTSENGVLFLPLDMTVVEVKFDNNVPLWMARLLSDLEYVSERMSKYCAALAVFWSPQVMHTGHQPGLHTWRKD